MRTDRGRRISGPAGGGRWSGRRRACGAVRRSIRSPVRCRLTKLQRVGRPRPVSLRTMAVHPERAARWSSRRERHPVWELLRHCDFVLVASAVLLSLIGAVMVYSATRVEQIDAGGDPKYYLKRQLALACDRPRGHGRRAPDRLSLARAVGLCDLRPRRAVALVAVLTHFGHTSLGRAAVVLPRPARAATLGVRGPGPHHRAGCLLQPPRDDVPSQHRRRARSRRRYRSCSSTSSPTSAPR